MLAFRALNRRKPRFHCPCCRYAGPFADVPADTGLRLHGCCPRCGALERHRLQWLVLDALEASVGLAGRRALHVAPEAALARRLEACAALYVSADLSASGVHVHADLTRLGIADRAFDLVYASHVLEHVADDAAALREIRRVLAPGGIAILPVPVVNLRTAEYPSPNPHEFGHVRAPGRDYFDRYRRHFAQVKLFRSEDFPQRHQLFEHEDRTRWPAPEVPLREAMAGDRHADYVPVCHA